MPCYAMLCHVMPCYGFFFILLFVVENMDEIQEKAYDCVVNSDIQGIFITGRGGTGKSFGK